MTRSGIKVPPLQTSGIKSRGEAAEHKRKCATLSVVRFVPTQDLSASGGLNPREDYKPLLCFLGYKACAMRCFDGRDISLFFIIKNMQ